MLSTVNTIIISEIVISRDVERLVSYSNFNPTTLKESSLGHPKVRAPRNAIISREDRNIKIRISSCPYYKVQIAKPSINKQCQQVFAIFKSTYNILFIQIRALTSIKNNQKYLTYHHQPTSYFIRQNREHGKD